MTQLDLIPPPAPPAPFQIGDARFAFLTRRRPSENMEAYIARDWRERVKQERKVGHDLRRDNTAQTEAKRRLAEVRRKDHWRQIQTVLSNGRELSLREIIRATGTDKIDSQMDYIAKLARDGKLIRREIREGNVRFFAYRLPEEAEK